jgi:hypothetical protein
MIHARADYNRIQDPAGRIPVDEPVFLLRGQDPLTPEVVEYWTALYTMRVDHDPAIASMVGKHVEAIRAWAAWHPRKVHTPDLPKAGQHSQDIQLGADGVKLFRAVWLAVLASPPAHQSALTDADARIATLNAEIIRLRAIKAQVESEIMVAENLDQLNAMAIGMMQGPYALEVSQGQHHGTLADIIRHYLMKERKSLRTRILHWLGRGAW